jgi:hypothetical protein
MIDGALKTPLRGKLSRATGEDFLTITALYDPNTKRVSFDRVNDDKTRTPALMSPEPAADVPAALAGALSMTYGLLPARIRDQLVQTPKRGPNAPAPIDISGAAPRRHQVDKRSTWRLHRIDINSTLALHTLDIGSTFDRHELDRFAAPNRHPHRLPFGNILTYKNIWLRLGGRS